MKYLVLTLAALLAGCALTRARAPESFNRDTDELVIDHPFFGYSGTSFEELTLDADFTIITGGTERADAGGSHRILAGEEVLWAVECASIADPEQRPSVYLTCLYRPGVKDRAPMSLALAASMQAPLRGVFFSEAGPLLIEGTMETDAGIPSPANVGFSILRADRAPLVFVDQGSPRISAYAGATITAEERRAIAPLLLTMVQARDARTALKSNSSGSIGVGPIKVNIAGDLEEDEDATPLPPPPRLPKKPTAFEEHVHRLIALGHTGAAAALALMLPQSSAIADPQEEQEQGEPGGPR